MRRAKMPRAIRATLRDWHSDPNHQEIEELEPDAAPTDYREAGFKNNDRVRIVPEALWREMRRELREMRAMLRRAVTEAETQCCEFCGDCFIYQASFCDRCRATENDLDRDKPGAYSAANRIRELRGTP